MGAPTAPTSGGPRPASEFEGKGGVKMHLIVGASHWEATLNVHAVHLNSMGFGHITHHKSTPPALALRILSMSDAPWNEVHRDARIMGWVGWMREIWGSEGGPGGTQPAESAQIGV